SSGRATYPRRSTFRWRSWNSGWPNYRPMGRLSPIVAARGASCRSRPSRCCVSVVIECAASKTASRNGRWPGFLSPYPQPSPEEGWLDPFWHPVIIKRVALHLGDSCRDFRGGGHDGRGGVDPAVVDRAR